MLLLRAPLGHPAFSAPPGPDLLLLPLLLVAWLGVATGCAAALHGATAATAAAAAGNRGRWHWLFQAYLRGAKAGGRRSDIVCVPQYLQEIEKGRSFRSA